MPRKSMGNGAVDGTLPKTTQLQEEWILVGKHGQEDKSCWISNTPILKFNACNIESQFHSRRLLEFKDLKYI